MTFSHGDYPFTQPREYVNTFALFNYSRCFATVDICRLIQKVYNFMFSRAARVKIFWMPVLCYHHHLCYYNIIQ